MSEPAGVATRIGSVDSFDEHRGTGVVVDEAGDAYPFHCTAVADGTRAIAPGTRVTFAVTPGLGRWEASDLRPV